MDYSLYRASKETLYVPLSFNARYRAKMVIDAFVSRSAKGVGSLGLTAVQLVAGPIALFALPLAAVGMSGVWLAAARSLFRKD
jgi:ATP/ADP translocase